MKMKRHKEGFTESPENTVSFAKRILETIEDSKKMGKEAKQTAVDKFSWRAVTKQIMDLYDTIVE